MATDHLEVDVCVIGGGPAGAAAALFAAAAGMSVAVVDRGGGAVKLGETLAPRGAVLLERLGVPVTAFRRAHARSVAWGGAHAVERPSILQPFGDDLFVDRDVLERLLRARLRASGVETLAARLHALERAGARWRALLGDGGPALSCRFVVDASGRAMWLSRREAGAPVRYDGLFGRSRVVAGGRRGADAAHRFDVASACDGWWYRAPLRDGAAVVTFFTDSDLRANVPWASCPLLDRGETTLRAFAAGAATQAARRIAGRGWVAVGDAAFARDPLSSQGLLDAFESAAVAVDALVRGEPAAYLEHQRARIADYFVERARAYGREARFADAPFWRRRARAAVAL